MTHLAFLVVVGIYSSAHTVASFTSGEAAFACADSIRNGVDAVCVEVVPLNPAGRSAGCRRFLVTIGRDGAVADVETWTGSCGGNACPELFDHTVWPPGQSDSAIDAHVWGKDEQHAVKVANEMRTRLIASGEWK